MAIYREQIAPNWLALRADALSDCLDYVSGIRPRTADCSSQYTHRPDWYGTATFGDALQLARFGWPEGLARMSGLVAQGIALRQPAPVMEASYDMGGAFPDVALYCAGDPCHMVTIAPEAIQTRPIYRFVINAGMRSPVSEAAAFNRGAAILSYIAKLEAEGARVELVSLRTCENKGKRFSYTFRIKAADENLDMDKAAFVFANASMLRRIGFAMGEMDAEITRWMGASYRSINDEPAQWQTANSVTFGAMMDDTGFETMARAIRSVEQTILFYLPAAA